MGEANIFVFLWRNLPVLPALPAVGRWSLIFGIMGLHNYVAANLSWYSRTILKLMGFHYTVRLGLPLVSLPSLLGGW